MTRNLALAALVALAISSLPMPAHAAELCSAEPNTLLFDCEKLCETTAKSKPPCMRSNASCTIECFPAAMQVDKETKTNYFAFLIPFSGGSAAANASAAARNASANGTLTAGDTISVSSLFASKSNDELKKIAQIKVPVTTTGACVRSKFDRAVRQCAR